MMRSGGTCFIITVTQSHSIKKKKVENVITEIGELWSLHSSPISGVVIL
jgi:hypothetical protein